MLYDDGYQGGQLRLDGASRPRLDTSPGARAATAAQLIECAAQTTRAWLDDGGLDQAFIPDELRDHQHTAAAH
jgi:hypothetical protein